MRCTTSDMSTMRKFTVSLLNPVPNELCTKKIIENMPCAQRAHRKIFLGENFIVCKTEHTRFNYALLRTAITKSKSKTETTKHTLEMNIKKTKAFSEREHAQLHIWEPNKRKHEAKKTNAIWRDFSLTADATPSTNEFSCSRFYSVNIGYRSTLTHTHADCVSRNTMCTPNCMTIS